MKFMLLMIPQVYQPEAPLEERAGEEFVPPAEAVAKMMKFNEELTQAGALISLDGLHPLTKGARVCFSEDRSTVTDGPFIETKEVIGGYWLIQAKTKAEAVAWARRCPAAVPPLMATSLKFARFLKHRIFRPTSQPPINLIHWNKIRKSNPLNAPQNYYERTKPKSKRLHAAFCWHGLA